MYIITGYIFLVHFIFTDFFFCNLEVNIISANYENILL